MKKRKLNWALLSTARINERLIPAIRESKNSQLMAVASRNLKNSKNYARKNTWNYGEGKGNHIID